MSQINARAAWSRNLLLGQLLGSLACFNLHTTSTRLSPLPRVGLNLPCIKYSYNRHHLTYLPVDHVLETPDTTFLFFRFCLIMPVHSASKYPEQASHAYAYTAN